MVKDHTIHRVPFVHLYRDLSFKDFFARYDPWRDGKVIAATYSFRHEDFDFWGKLLPNSVLYIGKNDDEPCALAFLRRIPWFQVRMVPRLHSKVIFLEKSGVLLLGSENLYAPSSSFSESMMETFVPESERQRVKLLLFGGLSGKLLLCKYGRDDVRIHAAGAFKRVGTPFLPCQTEVDYWSLTNNVMFISKGRSGYLHVPNRLYVVLEYLVSGRNHYLAFDRGYGYIGDLDEAAFDWLVANCRIRHQREENLDDCGELPAYHPIGNRYKPRRGTWFEEVKEWAEHEAMLMDSQPIDIANRKIHLEDSLEGMSG
jgi:hypothetical protein